jgi:energy-coupling factor transporter ATP-binding protein EcfA2
LAEQHDTVPLEKQHLSSQAANGKVSLVSLFHHRGVNALAENQTLRFGTGLTVVYGDNGAGKTGYIRILKHACHARGSEKILGNVVNGATPPAPAVTIKYKVGAEADIREWHGSTQNELLSRVSVFDTQCAAVYLTEKTDVAFRPLGLDLFDKLVKACKAVRIKLESEQKALGSSSLASLQATIPQGTRVAKFLASVNSLKKPESVHSLAQVSIDEEAHLASLEKCLLDLQTTDTEKLLRQLTLFAGRTQGLVHHINEVESCLSDEALNAVFDTRTDGRRKSAEAKQLRASTFPQSLLQGTGSDTWTALWEAARLFSLEQAYKGEAFPVIGDNARCVLCQQNINHEVAGRLQQFQDFVVSTFEQELRQVRDRFAQQRRAFANLKTTTGAIEEALNEIRIENENVADAISAALASNEKRRAAVLSALMEDRDLVDFPALVSIKAIAEAFLLQIHQRINTLSTNANNQTRKHMIAEAQELRARLLLAANKQSVLDEIERIKKHAAYRLCMDDTKTQAITTKSTAITKTVVSSRLKKSFQDELINLSFHHTEVEIRDLGGIEGVFYHKLVLTRAPGVDLPKIVSEGEQRCLSIAAFFAELSTTDEPSGIVFDDPMSSLDFQWRNSVARRLAQESKIRQVIVFTHDIVFLLALKQYAQELDVDLLDQHIRRLANGAGVCSDELPWVALPVKRKIGYLNKRWQEADKLARAGQQDAYERDAKYLYGLLREAWERALEEVLLGGIVERYRPSVQTQQISQIADISHDDCRAVETAMTKCSTWLAGHDKAPAARAPVPAPSELRADIEVLTNWVSAIRKRREKKTSTAVHE